MAMEKRGVIDTHTPSETKPSSNLPDSDQVCEPHTVKQADEMEEHLTTRLCRAARQKTE